MDTAREFCPMSVSRDRRPFDIFVNDRDRGIESSLSKFAGSTKLSGADDTIEGWYAIQEDLGKFEKLTHENLMKFHKSKCQVLHLCQGKPRHEYKLGEKSLRAAHREGLISCHRRKAEQETAVYASNPESQVNPQKRCDQQVWKGILPLYSAFLRSQLECCIQLRGLQHKRDVDHLTIIGQVQRGAMRMIGELEHLFCKDRQCYLGMNNIWAIHPGDVSGKTSLQHLTYFNLLKVAYKKEGKRFFLHKQIR